jgi:nicotinate-nucleotide adenylyltransferase
MGGARQRAGTALTRVGLLGGSFNPAHGGHRRVSLFALEALELDEVWWLVSPGNPLKPKTGMAPLAARLASAAAQARGTRIKPTAIERDLGTRFTLDTLRALRRRYPKVQFIWLMGSDNLAQFHRWWRWREIARTMPIAVIARPGYEGAAFASPAGVWLGRFRRPPASLRTRAGWSAPALIYLRFDPDSRSATALRAADPHWASRFTGRQIRDPLTHHPIAPDLTSSRA